MKTKTFVTSFITLVMLNASIIPVFANPIIEQESRQNQEISVKEVDLFVVIPQGETLSSKELEQIEGDGLIIAGIVSKNKQPTNTLNTLLCYNMVISRCGWSNLATSPIFFGNTIQYNKYWSPF
jgi:hypothetical protein